MGEGFEEFLSRLDFVLESWIKSLKLLYATAYLAIVCSKNAHITSTRISYSSQSFNKTVSFSNWSYIAAMEQIFPKTHCSFKIFLTEKHFCLWDYPNLCYYMVCIFSESAEKLVCKTVMQQQHFGHVCSTLSPSAEASRGSHCWSVAVPQPWKRTKTVRKKDTHPKGRLQLH